MIRIGLSQRDKQREIKRYIAAHGIRSVFVFYPEQFPLPVDTGAVTAEHVRYVDIIMYKFFYRLLEVIDQHTLLVFNECMRTQKRSDLTYNCAHHYCNQTPHKLVFEYFPLIDTKDDFMILLDLIDKGRYKGKSFDYAMLQDADVQARPRRIRVSPIHVETTEQEIARYEREKERLFANLGSKDPDTIPRALQLVAGDVKKKVIRPDGTYVARNARLGLPNVVTYKDVTGRGQFTVVDTHYRRLNFNDFLKVSGMTRVDYLCTTLPIDNYITNDLTTWGARLDAFYAKTSLYS